ncbi:MAG: hypothetical protein QW520_03020 [Methanomassiliicoccales archaeon]
MNPDPIDLFLRFCFVGFSIILVTISLFALKRSKEVRIALVSASFLLFAILALLVFLSSFMGLREFEMSATVVLFQLLVLALLYLAILKR